eukprot:c9339_g1_i1.p1 GENE.c9339_g1_i1~~c9339_g1_i1.p1  ORF type:complete len:692 (-),score=176.17 c9339_g1_i1:141-2216(-)
MIKYTRRKGTPSYKDSQESASQSPVSSSSMSPSVIEKSSPVDTKLATKRTRSRDILDLDDVISEKPSPKSSSTGTGLSSTQSSSKRFSPEKLQSAASTVVGVKRSGSVASTSSRLALSDSGETQALLDDFTYVADGADINQSVGMRQQSVLALFKLWQKSSSLGLSMVLRARGALDRILAVLTQANGDEGLHLVFSSFLFVILQDKANSSAITSENTQFLLEILNDNPTDAAPSRTSTRTAKSSSSTQRKKISDALIKQVRDLIGEDALDTINHSSSTIHSRQLALHSLITACRHSGVVRGVLTQPQSLKTLLSATTTFLSKVIQEWTTKTEISNDLLLEAYLALKLLEQVTNSPVVGKDLILVSQTSESMPLSLFLQTIAMFEESMNATEAAKKKLSQDVVVVEMIGAILGVLVNASNDNEIGCEVFGDSNGLQKVVTLLHALLCVSAHSEGSVCQTRVTVQSYKEQTPQQSQQSQNDTNQTIKVPFQRQHNTQLIDSAESAMDDGPPPQVTAVVSLENFDIITLILSLIANCVEHNSTNRLYMFHMQLSSQTADVTVSAMDFLTRVFLESYAMQDNTLGGDHVGVMAYIGVVLAFVAEENGTIRGKLRGLLGNTFTPLKNVLQEFLQLQKDASILTPAFTKQIEQMMAMLEESNASDAVPASPSRDCPTSSESIADSENQKKFDTFAFE